MPPNPPWADLPEELLTSIAASLSSNPVDILAFRSVCKSWHSSSSSTTAHHTLSPFLPRLTPTPPDSLSRKCSDMKHGLLFITLVYSLRRPSQHTQLPESHIWVCFVDQWTNHKMSVRKNHISYLLPTNFPNSLNLLDFCPTELGRFYNLALLPVRDSSARNFFKYVSSCFDKVILLSNMSAVVILSCEGKLGLKWLEVGEVRFSEQWEIIHDGKGFRFDDIVEFKGMLLGVDWRGMVYEIGLDNNPVTVDPIILPITGLGRRRKRLIESLGELYLVVQCELQNTFEFKVYQLLFTRKIWGQVVEIGDRVFLFESEFSLSVSTEQLGGECRKNCIVYKAGSFRNYNHKDNGDFMIFQGNDLCMGVWHLEDPAHICSIKTYPSYSKLFWPPPSWICPVDTFVNSWFSPMTPKTPPNELDVIDRNWLDPAIAAAPILGLEDKYKCFRMDEASIDQILMMVPDALKECRETTAGELEKEEQLKSEDAIFFDMVNEQRKEKVYELDSRLDEAERVVEVSMIIAKKSDEATHRNMKVTEESGVRAKKITKQLENFHRLYQSSNCSSPSTSSQSSGSHHPF